MESKKIKKLRTSLKIVQTIGLVVLFLLFLSLVLPYIFGSRYYIINNGSMAPTLNVGDIIYVKKVEFEEVKVDDIATFSSQFDSNMTFTHRIVDILEDELLFVTKGDANNSVDPSAAHYSQMVGVMQLQIPWVGNIPIFLKSITGIVVLLTLGVAYVIFDLVVHSSILKLEEKKQEVTDNE